MSPDEYCQNKAAQSGSSFYYAFLFLPPERRRAITALYAFCREVDDVVDEVHEESVARMKLVWWRTQVADLYEGRAHHPVMQALAPHIEAFGLPQDELLAVIDGMEMDLDQMRYPSWSELERYCWHAASVVGLLSARIFGQTQEQTSDYAQKLGLAFQLTNIIRDVGDDARRGRIYLPQEDLDKFGVSPHEILDQQHSERFEALMAFQTERAQDLYRQAMRALPAVDRRAQRPGLLMAAIYHALLVEIANDRWHVLEQRISLTPIRKFWLAWKTWVSGGRSLQRKLGR
ncbi:presqualene diphosphate synthase HpnD [Alcaligenes aquatilis]|uniref:Presqualene diphosphate synthase HpnD n=1 Tax=Alcaligenes aquatilis TaxID=323284 RepID=A0ABY4NKK4_9BURK|nr:MULTISPECIES: presqualene diphosphate synthase HpnD [Alcaligenes]QXR37018.1 presqualene diphosphate synthase HpnD [Alcaligenes aquatilis]UQN37024.1 presqualene diphosphate synthase HpnD [Alcaligenes aquatilis]UYY88347.1 presqualene diphosphate synthase HpnD [Alcaligenes sp. SMD-FA]HBQ89594.1 squalene synthase HpnD [Alcaligenes faecalis]